MQSVADNGKLHVTETFIFLTDETTQISITANHLVDCKHLGINNITLWNSGTIKYNETGFCTFLKPYCIEYLYTNGFANVMYCMSGIC